MKQNSKQSQNNKLKKNKKSVSDYHDSCNVKERKETN